MPLCSRRCASARTAHERGVDVYTTDFIPFAHGVRLFGAAYNDVLHPEVINCLRQFSSRRYPLVVR